MGIWAHGHMGIWVYGNMGLWAYGHMGPGHNMGIWAYAKKYGQVGYPLKHTLYLSFLVRHHTFWPAKSA